MDNREQTTYNQIVHVEEGGEILVLDYTFKHADNFKGATGSRFYPVSKAQYNEQTKVKAIEERLRDSVNEHEIPLIYREGEKIRYKNPYLRWAKAIKDAGEAESFAFDTSYSNLWDYMRDELGLSDKDAFIFECCGGGRMFDKDFQGNYNPVLSGIIREFES